MSAGHDRTGTEKLAHHGGVPLLIEVSSGPTRVERRSTPLTRRNVTSRPVPTSKFQSLPTTLQPSGFRWYPACKAVLEWLAAVVLAVVAAPLVFLAAALVKVSSPGPAFYTQTRVGRNGRLFPIFKIRTMVHNCESLTGPRWSMPGDPRVTVIGQILRRTHLDELPQLLNVLRGDMALIGPRPERPEFVPELEQALPAYRQRLAVRPGVTGLAQVRLAADTDLNSVRKKLAHDLYYIQHLNPFLELRILFCTIFYTFGDPGKLSHRLHLVPAAERIENDLTVTLLVKPEQPAEVAA